MNCVMGNFLKKKVLHALQNMGIFLQLGVLLQCELSFTGYEKKKMDRDKVIMKCVMESKSLFHFNS